MTFKPRHGFLPCVPGAFAGGLRRTEFFDGMVLSEDDMKREQAYWQMKRRLTNRALGQGVVWGLTLSWDEKSRCFTLCPGYGLSCCGDDLVVECPERICEPELIDPCSEEFREILKAAHGPCTDPCERPDEPVEACLLLEYVECPEDPRQVFEDPCATLPGGCKFGAVRETTRLRLVPPPPPPGPGPVDRFCAKIAELQATLAEAGIAAPDLGEAGVSAAAAPVLSIALVIEDAVGTQLASQDGALEMVAGQIFAANFVNSAAQRLTVEMTPPVGYGFLWVQDGNQELTQIETLMGVSFAESDLAEAGQMDRTVRAELAPLLGGQSHEVTIRFTARREGDHTIAEAEVMAAQALDRVPDCGTLMKTWIFNTDPACAVKTLPLAALCGWFKGLIGTAPCATAPDEVDRSRAAVAWLVCWLAWQMLWKIDISNELARDAERCLRQLFEDWCAEFHYKGPRCDHHLHGIVLGCVMLDPKGRILCFDEWKHRRYVLTGPLATHWMGLFGFAPLDVAATRLADWICCVARAPDISLSAEEIAAVQQQFLNDDGELILGGGSTLDIEAMMSGFSGIFSGSFSGSAPVGGLSEHAAHAALANSRRVEAQLEMAPAMARAPARELLGELTSALAVADFKPVGDPAVFEAAVSALDAAEINTAEHLFAAAPEETADRIRTALIAKGAVADAAGADKAVAQVFAAAERAVEAAGRAVIAEAEDRPEDELFTRADIKEVSTTAAVRKAVNEHLKGRGLSAALVKGIAARVADRR